MISARPTVKIVDDEATLIRVCRFRYHTYINELGTAYGQIDLGNGILRDELDDFGVTFYAEHKGEIIGTMRLNFGADGEFDEYWFECYQLADFPDLKKVCLASKMMIAPQWRDSGLSQDMLLSAYQSCLTYKAEFLFLDCIIPLVRIYEQIGFRRYKTNAPEDANLKYYVPLVLVLNDLPYFEEIQSPWTKVIKETYSKRSSTSWFNDWVPRELGLTFEPQLDLSDLEISLERLENPPDLMEGLTKRECLSLLAESTILQVLTNERVSYQGDTCDALFLILDGVFKSCQHKDQNDELTNKERAETETTLEYYHSGETMGLEGFINRTRRASSFVATQDSCVAVITQMAWRRIRRELPQLAERLALNLRSLYTLHQSPYRITEREISRRHSVELKTPVRVFKLQKLGIDQESLIQLFTKDLERLAWDYYDQRRARLNLLQESLPSELERILICENDYYHGVLDESALSDIIDQLNPEQRARFWDIKPHRRRSICQFYASKIHDGSWSIERIRENEFTQNVEDYRSLERCFEQTSDKLTDHPEFQALLKALIEMTLEFSLEAKRIKLIAHEMSTSAFKHRQGENSPEGIHQDGSMFIVSALLLSRQAVKGGRSELYRPHSVDPFFEYTLMPGEGIFQMDRGTQLWHRVSPITLDERSDTDVAERNILGFDIEVLA